MAGSWSDTRKIETVTVYLFNIASQLMFSLKFEKVNIHANIHMIHLLYHSFIYGHREIKTVAGLTPAFVWQIANTCWIWMPDETWG